MTDSTIDIAVGFWIKHEFKQNCCDYAEVQKPNKQPNFVNFSGEQPAFYGNLSSKGIVNFFIKRLIIFFLF